MSENKDEKRESNENINEKNETNLASATRNFSHSSIPTRNLFRESSLSSIRKQQRIVRTSSKSPKRSASQKQSKIQLARKQMDENSQRYEIRQLSEDKDDDFNEDEFIAEREGNIRSELIQDIDPHTIVDFFNENDLQPTTADMILDFEPSSNEVEKKNYTNKSILKAEANESKRSDISEIKSKTRLNSASTGSMSQPLKSNLKKTLQMRAKFTASPTNKENNTKKELDKSRNSRNSYKKKETQNSSDDKEADSDEIFEYENFQNLDETDQNGQKAKESTMLKKSRMLKQKQQQLQHQQQKEIKNLSRQQLEIRQHQHQYPHPTHEQRMVQQEQIKLMFSSASSPDSETLDDNPGISEQLNQPRFSTAANLQSNSGYISEINDKIDYWGHLLIGLSYFFLIFSFPFSLCTCFKVAQEYERAVIFRLGRILKGGAKGPGIFFVLPCIDTYTKVDLRTVTFDVPPQEILTKDSVTVSVDAVVYFRIFNAVISVINVEDAAKSTKLLAASTLRNILGTKSLHEILSDRESVAILIQYHLDEATEPCKDVRLPVQLQRAMATEAEAAREARAKVIAAEGEQKASKALKEAAEVISESPIAIQLRYLQTLTQIASEKNSTIVFPIPLEMLSFLANKTVDLFKL